MSQWGLISLLLRMIDGPLRVLADFPDGRKCKTKGHYLAHITSNIPNLTHVGGKERMSASGANLAKWNVEVVYHLSLQLNLCDLARASFSRNLGDFLIYCEDQKTDAV